MDGSVSPARASLGPGCVRVSISHARGEIAPTVAVFVNPGHAPTDPATPRAEVYAAGAEQRRQEYDALTDSFGRFLIEEVLPFVEAKEGLTLTRDPEHRTVCGISSGGICAFTVAWERPDAFRKVISHIGSFTNIRGGHVYPALIRKTDKKPLKVFLQDGKNDLDNQFGNWPLANQDMAASLKFAGYNYQFVLGEGTHNGKHGGAMLPDTLRWLWKK
jgi:enterochelin esterase family protein